MLSRQFRSSDIVVESSLVMEQRQSPPISDSPLAHGKWHRANDGHEERNLGHEQPEAYWSWWSFWVS